MAVPDIGALITQADNRAFDTISSARAEISGSATRLAEIFDTVLDLPTDITYPDQPDAVNIPDPPELQQPELDVTGAPADIGTLDTVPDVLSGIVPAPVLTAIAPTINLPTKPSEVAAFTGTAPVVVIDAVFPDPPALLDASLGDMPTISDVVMPTRPNIATPSFDAVMPAPLADAPTGLDAQFLANYRELAPQFIGALEGQLDAMLAKINPRFSEQMAAVESRLSTYLAGGTALTPAIENQIQERAKDKVKADTRRGIDTAYSDAANRGFTVPPGSVLAAVTALTQAGNDALGRSATDIAVKQAELEQQNMQFAVTQSTNLRQVVLQAAISYHSNLVQLNGQAVNAAQQVVALIVEGYNTTVRAFTARLEAYKAEASVYETKLKAIETFVRVYEAEIRAMEAQVNVDRARIEAFKATVDVLNSLASVYRTRVDAVVARASLEKLKIDAFGATVQAYESYVRGQTAAWQGYTAAVQGEEAKAKLYGEQVSAFNVQTQAWRAQVDAKNTQVQAVVARNKGIVDVYTAKWQGYGEKVRAGGAKASAVLDFQKTLLVQYGGRVQAAIAESTSKAEYYRVASTIAVERNKLEATKIFETAKIRIGAADGIARTAMSSAGMYASLAQASLSGMNTLVGAQQT